MPMDENSGNTVEAIVDEFTRRLQAGESPSVDEFVSRLPEKAPELERILSALSRFELTDPDASGPGTSGRSQILNAPAKSIGDFQILREVGRGGMGIVYEAEQISLGRRVALKVLPAHSNLTPRRLERFHREARAAAMLHHSNIVPVFGVGEDDGLTFYAMQFIEGAGLDQVLAGLRQFRSTSGADANNLGASNDIGSLNTIDGEAPSSSRQPVVGDELAELLKARRWRSPISSQHDGSAIKSGSGRRDSSSTKSLSGNRPVDSMSGEQAYFHSVAQIGEQVADAIHYAHEQGVLHRDIKPSNLMLDRFGHVWVTDFGLAKTLDERELTQTGELVGTLRYLPPEQFQGESDARGDVYSLGLTLYELLTLTPAFEATNRTQLIVKVSRDVPEPPRKVEADIPKDLETIILKSIAREPQDRYQSAELLRDDLRRFLQDEPILARRESSIEALRRWRRRNPAIANSIFAVITISLIAFVSIFTLWTSEKTQRQRAEGAEEREREQRIAAEAEQQRADEQADRAERNLSQAMKAVRQLTLVGEHFLQNVPGMEDVRKQLLTESLRFYQDFLSQNESDPELAIEVALAHRRAGRINRFLGHLDEATNDYQQSIKLFESQPTPTVLQQHDIASLHRELSGVYREKSDYDSALKHLNRSLEVLQSLEKEPSAKVVTQRLLVETLADLGKTESILGNESVARQYFVRAVTLREKLQPASASLFAQAESVADRSFLAMSLTRYGQLDKAIAEFQQMIKTMQTVHQAYPDISRYRITLFRLYRNLGDTYRDKGMFAQAEEALGNANGFITRLLADYPAVRRHHFRAAQLKRSYSILFTQLNRGEEARDAYLKQIEILTRLQAKDPDSIEIRASLAQARTDLGFLMSRMGQQIEALPILKLSYADFTKLSDEQPAVSSHRRFAATALTSIGGIQVAQGNLNEALKNYRTSLALRKKLSEDIPEIGQIQFELAESHHNIGFILEQLKDNRAAIEAHKIALGLRKTLHDAATNNASYKDALAKSYNSLANLRVDSLANYRKAAAIWESLVRAESTVPEQRNNLAGVHFNLAYELTSRGQGGEASRHLNRADSMWRQLMKEYPETVGYRFALARVCARRGQLTKGTQAIAAHRESIKLVKGIAAPTEEHLNLLAGTTSNLGIRLSAIGKTSEAEQLYKDALIVLKKLNPQVPRNIEFLANVTQNLALLQFRQGRLGDVESMLTQVTKLRKNLESRFPGDLRLINRTAVTYQKLAEYFLKVDDLENAAECYDEELNAYQRAADSSQSSAKLAKQQQIAQRAERIGRSFYRNKPVQAAKYFDIVLKHHEQALKNDPDMKSKQSAAAAWSRVGDYLKRANGTDVGLEWLERAITLRRKIAKEQPSDFNRAALAEDLRRKGQALDQMGDFKGALESFDEGIKLLQERVDAEKSPLSNDILSYTFTDRATLLALFSDTTKRDTAKAMESAEAALKLDPKQERFVAAMVVKGICQYRNGDIEASVTTLESSTEDKAHNRELGRLHLAMALWQAGKKEKAKQLLNKVNASFSGSVPGYLAPFVKEARELLK